MKRFWTVILGCLAGSFASLAVAQGNSASLIDLTTNTVLSHFIVGNNPAAVAWAGNNTAYVVADDGNTMVRLDMTTSPPAVIATYTFPAGFDPHGLAINSAGTRALVTGDTTSVYLLNLTTNPISVADTITVPVLDAGGVAFYFGDARGVIVNESNLLFLDLTVTPAGVTTVALGTPGLDVAVDAAGTRAAVSLDGGGLQVIDLTTSPPSLLGGVLGPGIGTADPLGVAVSPDGSRAVYVDESIPAAEANVINLTGAPAFVNTVPIALSSPSGVAFNPATSAVLISADNGVAILNAPYTAVNATITDPGFSGTTAHAIAVNPAGTRAIVLNEDAPVLAPPARPQVPIPTTSPLGLALLALLLLAASAIVLVRRR
jgi:DNA-binding beta-propeller fold protein YncE